MSPPPTPARRPRQPGRPARRAAHFGWPRQPSRPQHALGAGSDLGPARRRAHHRLAGRAGGSSGPRPEPWPGAGRSPGPPTAAWCADLPMWPTRRDAGDHAGRRRSYAVRWPTVTEPATGYAEALAELDRILVELEGEGVDVDVLGRAGASSGRAGGSVSRPDQSGPPRGRTGDRTARWPRRHSRRRTLTGPVTTQAEGPRAPPPITSRYPGVTLAIIIVIWGIGPPISKLISAPPLVTVFLRFWISVPILIVAARATGGRVNRTTLRSTWLAGALFAGNLACVFFSLQRVTIAVLSVVQALQPGIVHAHGGALPRRARHPLARAVDHGGNRRDRHRRTRRGQGLAGHPSGARPRGGVDDHLHRLLPDRQTGALHHRSHRAGVDGGVDAVLGPCHYARHARDHAGRRLRPARRLGLAVAC